ncbi:hypothetical protein PENSPDRAFT_739694 [Peniophora sp. CONT]|nr:hypothetical protein PENSPDRAFT_739694 [Peniophora sp. CONT]
MMSLASGPLSRIPEDIICELYAILADVDPPHHDKQHIWGERIHYLGWIRLTHVSRRFRSVAIGLHSLWGNIVCTLPRGCKTILERSRNMPLTLNLRHHGGPDYSELLPIFDILRRARHVSDQWKEEDPPRRKVWWTAHPFPSLEYFKLWASKPSPVPGGLGHLTAPALHTYIAIGIFVPLTAPLLQELDLTCEVGWKEVLDFLRSCPLLATLRLVNLIQSTTMHAGPPSAISLPHLKSLSIHIGDNLNSAVAFHILDHLIFPQSATVNFDAVYWPLEDPRLPSALLAHHHLQSSARDTLSIIAQRETEDTLGLLEIQISENRGRPFSEHGALVHDGSGITTELDEHEDALQLAKALTPLSPATLQSIRLLAIYAGREIENAYEDPDNWYDPLALSEEAFTETWQAARALENVETVYFRDIGQGSMSLLMPHPEWEASEENHVAFPNLRTIVIDTVQCKKRDHGVGGDLLEVIEARLAVGRPIERVVLMSGGLGQVTMDIGR